ncbi:MAG: PhzF family phenazine biosynthesis protein [Terracidiphilus sp.]|jgi:PhzF family phenazine biosynthesis protein
MAIPYYHVDVFTNELFAGNPAGVCILSAFLAESIMQKIAAENRHSETAFVVPRADSDFDLRWFTPTVEDDLCGHATLASAFVLALRQHAVWPIRFHTRAGVLTVAQIIPDQIIPAQITADHDPVAQIQGSFEMDFPARPPQPCETPADLLPALGLKAALVMKSRDYMVVVDQAEQVRALTPNIVALARIEMGNGGAIVTAPGEGDVDYVCRLFAPAEGIDEDPATGSIHCTLAPYWAERLGKRAMRAQQLSARGGFMQCSIAGDRVKIAGTARLYLQGTLEL